MKLIKLNIYRSDYTNGKHVPRCGEVVYVNPNHVSFVKTVVDCPNNSSHIGLIGDAGNDPIRIWQDVETILTLLHS